MRNMRGIGVDLGRCVKDGLLKFQSSRPSFQGLETHLAAMHKQIKDFSPKTVIIDPISNLHRLGTDGQPSEEGVTVPIEVGPRRVRRPLDLISALLAR